MSLATFGRIAVEDARVGIGELLVVDELVAGRVAARRNTGVGSSPPGLVFPCRPPPVHDVTCSALSMRHVRVEIVAAIRSPLWRTAATPTYPGHRAAPPCLSGCTASSDRGSPASLGCPWRARTDRGRAGRTCPSPSTLPLRRTSSHRSSPAGACTSGTSRPSSSPSAGR